MADHDSYKGMRLDATTGRLVYAHDPLCSPDDIYPDDAEDEFCHCQLVARVRADERRLLERTAAEAVVTTHDDGTVSVKVSDPFGIGWVPVATPLIENWVTTVNDLAAAEAVAAKLVEVIDAQERLIRAMTGQAADYIAQRDAARAEVAALRELIPVAYGMGRDDEAAALPMRQFDMSALIDGAR